MIISGIIKNSFIDYPGLISCVLFVPNCNYDCFYCHNRNLIDGTHHILDTEEIISYLQKRTGMIDAVVISGGEPTLQKELAPFMKKFKKMGYKIKLDTNGSSPNVISDLIDSELCDYFAVDYKAPSKSYAEICGNNADSKKVIETIKLLLSSGVNFEVRTTVIPQLSKEELIVMSKELPILPRYVLNRYRVPDNFLSKDELRIKKRPYSQMEVNQFVEALKAYQPNITT